MSNERILKALIARTKTLPFSPEIDISWPDESYKPTAGREYIEFVWLPNETNTFTIANSEPQQRLGLLQLSVIYPRNAGLVEGSAIADTILEHFGKGTIMTEDGVRVKIIRQPWATQPFKEQAWVRIPVSIPYQCMA